MTELSPAKVAASVSRALWGEVADKLRSVQFSAAENRIELRFVFDGNLDDIDMESIGTVGAEVAAGFPNSAVSEEAVTTTVESDIPCGDGWYTAYARREVILVR